MTRVYEPLQTIWTAIGLSRCKEGNAVVSPSKIAGKLSDRHQFNVSHSKFDEMIESFNRAIERTCGGERADVHLVDHGARQRRSLPTFIAPSKLSCAIDAGCSVNSIRHPR